MFARSTVEDILRANTITPSCSSVEFTDYREYFPATIPKHIDWRAYGVRGGCWSVQYEAERT